MTTPEALDTPYRRPVVSVIMANFNGGAHLADAIRSAQNQTLRDIEIIVSDDASSDDSVAIVTQLQAADQRIVLLQSDRNEGPAAARNRALGAAKGEWVAILDSDDLIHPKRLATLVELAERDKADIIADDLVEFYADNSRPSRALLGGQAGTDPAWVDIVEYIGLNSFYGVGPNLGYLKPMFRASALARLDSRYDETLKIAEDFDLVLRLLHAGCRMRIYPLAFYFYRKHETSISHHLSTGALEAIKTSTLRFQERLSGSDKRLAMAVRSRLIAIDTALAYEQLLHALKNGKSARALHIALTNPRAAVLLRLPIQKRLQYFSRRFPVRKPAQQDTNAPWLAYGLPSEALSPDGPGGTGPCDARSTSVMAPDGTAGNHVAVTVCICTFRRTSVLDAIKSVADQILPNGITLRILVIDNDDVATARKMVLDFGAAAGVILDYRHVPGRNISIARNAALDAVTTPWLVFMDDDEVACADWLLRLLSGRDHANAIFGPCEAIYDGNAPAWIRAGDYHSNRLCGRGRPILTGYTSNVLVDMNFVRKLNLRFDPALGRTGGEDTIFFRAMHRAGGVLRYASDAVVYERVVPGRVNLRWIVTRRYRAGQIYAMMFHASGKGHYWRFIATTPLKIAACLFASAALVLDRSRSMWWLMRGVFHLGALSFVFGAPVHEEYSPSRSVLLHADR
jgi:succinoglycan biosynthesis protein ExoM